MEESLKMKNSDNTIPVTAEGPEGRGCVIGFKYFIEMCFTHCMIHLFKVYTEFGGF